ncbi:hypothetical protein H7849_11140 [Alloacidobacterium dinghuense]|uniref:Uncharacterized protein n=1 Tax=Alloacidobacterium dinghuense TaxID=2763107 RepID=A0A7G8BPC0_9BACT|nr:hypothetical protein [Alloacidobacterium dinghuense]QNI34390.1 hypothetical protein H7849_11140 [Alloacidobacterium dinghuense]
MNTVAWPLIELSAKLLDRNEREAVLGDLLETNEVAWRGFLDVIGLAFRRHAALWKSPRPWLAAFAVALPSSYLLRYVSVSVSCTWLRLVNHKVYGWQWPTGHEGFPLLFCHILLLIAWSWTAGYIVGSLSRRTLWVSASLSVLPVVLNLSHSDGLPRLCLFLFLLPAIVGVRHGLRNVRISLPAASLLAFTMTVLMISAWSYGALWALNWALILPTFYLVVAAWRSQFRTAALHAR